MIGYEEKLLMAGILKDCAASISRAIGVTESIGKRDLETLRGSDRAANAADKICIDAPEIIKALLELAGRYER